MEIYEYYGAIKNFIKVFGAIVIVMTGVVLILTMRQPIKYDGAAAITVVKHSPLNQDNVNFYLYDNYYSSQASGLFSGTIENWIHSPAVVQEIYQTAGVNLPNTQLSDYTKIFQSKRPTDYTNVLNITTSTNSKDNTRKLLLATIQVIKSKNDDIAKNDPQRAYDIFSSDPIVVEKKPAVLLNTGIAFVLSLILGIITVTFLKYLSKKR